MITTCRLDDNIEEEKKGKQVVKLKNGFYWQRTAYSERFSAFSNDISNSTKLRTLLVGDLKRPAR